MMSPLLNLKPKTKGKNYMLNSEYKFLKKWEHPQNYLGQTWPEYYVGLSRNRDSRVLDVSNFEVFLHRLGGESETVQIVHERHWLCGWVEWIAISQDDKEACEMADAMLKELEEYPILDDQDFLERECETIIEIRKNYTDEEILRDYGSEENFEDRIRGEI